MRALIASAEDQADLRRRVGARALELEAASGAARQAQWRATVASRLPSPEWPVETIIPDHGAEHLFGANGMEPTLRAPAARAGHDQGRALADRVGEFWR
ncbi:MAG: hypothetical protein HOQ00_06220 [Agromyces sp.]|nr:hypothetical protein [Agromyces sp.]